MLQLKNITKDYVSGDSKVNALRSVSISFRENEFVSILGQSGCGKTTMLNIIGGLDRYTDGDLIINGVSTKKYSDGDWDVYRNRSIGFVFQNYNLIPHQTVLQNVELALTLSGISRHERRERAVEVLNKVGLGDQLYKKPNQMSGGQMQRVAIARALINNPDILLADEPTGALDSETSVQVMDLLKEIAQDKLVIMVTHNPELADKYSTRIIRLLDGKVIDDTNPFELEENIQPEVKKAKKIKKKPMKMLTALSLSLNNLLTKKGRTILTSVAGSIGIIGIALILALSNGIQVYIDTVQKDTLSSYPITIEKEAMDLSGVIESISGEAEQKDHPLDAVYQNSIMYELNNAMSESGTQINNLEKFKEYLESSNQELDALISSVQYSYDINFNTYIKDADGSIVSADVEKLLNELLGIDSSSQQGSAISTMMESSGMMSSYNVWQELMCGKDGTGISDVVKDQYDVIYGSWPAEYNEIVLVVDEYNQVSDLALYALGIKSEEDMKSAFNSMLNEETVDISDESWSYEEICSKTFRLVPNYMMYQKDTKTGLYKEISISSAAGMNYIYDNGIELKISGIIRPSEDATATAVSSPLAYTSDLTQYVIKKSSESDVIKAQMDDVKIDILNGLPFATGEETEPADSQKAEDITEYFAGLETDEKAKMFITIASVPSDEYVQAAVSKATEGLTREQIEQNLGGTYAEEMGVSEEQLKEYLASMDDETLMGHVKETAAESVREQYAEQVKTQYSAFPATQLAAMFDALVSSSDETVKAEWYDNYMPPTVSQSSYSENLTLLGYIDENSPSSISIYADTFEAKDQISEYISDYNESAAEEDKITYTDYVALLMSSITTIISAISYVLIAFVAISLVVSSIMIGIITYISVLERIKEIGILRSIGASKKDISRVFNAETLIVGFLAGAIGIGFTVLACLPINHIIRTLTGISNIGAALPPIAGIVLVLISMALTFIAGLIPAKVAANKDPVIALRTE